MESKPSPRADLPLEAQLFTEIGVIDQLARNHLERSLPEGLSAAQFGVMNHFRRLGRVETPAELASAFQVTRGAMTNTLQRLAAHGYVQIVGDPKDGRVKRVTLTEAGARAHDEIMREVGPQFVALREALPQEDLQAALAVLQRLRAWLDARR